MFLKILLVIGLSTFEIYAAIAAGNLADLSKWTILICTLIGGVLGTFIAAFFGQKIRNFIDTKVKKNTTPKPKTGMIYKIWDKYGLYGLSLIGTFFFGSPIAMGVGVGFNAPLKKMIPLCLVAVVVRCFVFTFLGNVIKGFF